MNDDLLVRIAVTGVTGRMGKEIVRRCIIMNDDKSKNYCSLSKFDSIVFGAAIANINSNVCGKDLGTLIGTNNLGIIISYDLNKIKEDFDVLIDFTCPDASMEYLKFCTMNNKNMIIGTTGFNKKHMQLIECSAEKIGIVYSPNFSIGINLMLKLLGDITLVMGHHSDIDIIEMHHRNKKDIPSGTAIIMRDIINHNLFQFECSKKNNNDNNKLYYSREFCDENNKKNGANVFSLRSGDVIGEHSVLFSSVGERLEITHKAYNRSIFANGALQAAIWLGKSKIGLFNMNHVLGIE